MSKNKTIRSLSVSKKRTFVYFPVRGSEITNVKIQHELARSPSLQPLTIIIKVNENSKKIKKDMKNDEKS